MKGLTLIFVFMILSVIGASLLFGGILAHNNILMYVGAPLLLIGGPGFIATIFWED